MSILSGSGQSSGHKYIPPKKQELKPSKDLEIFSERLRRVTAAYAGIHLEYNPIQYSERYQLAQEKVSLRLQLEHPEYALRRLLGITRVKLPVPGLFEDAEGKNDDTVKSALVYKIQVDIEKEDSVKAGAHGDLIHHCLFVIGRYEAPIPRYTFNDKHEITSSRTVGITRKYFIKDTPQNIKEIIKKYGQPFKTYPYTVAIAHPSGSAYYVDNRTYSVYEFEDFLNTSIDDLIDANKSGFLEEGKKDRMELWAQFIKKQTAKRKEGENYTAKKFLKDIDTEE